MDAARPLLGAGKEQDVHLFNLTQAAEGQDSKARVRRDAAGCGDDDANDDDGDHVVMPLPVQTKLSACAMGSFLLATTASQLTPNAALTLLEQSIALLLKPPKPKKSKNE